MMDGHLFSHRARRSPGLRGMVSLFLTLRRMRAHSSPAEAHTVLELGARYLARWRGSRELYRRLAAAAWAGGAWKEARIAGRLALAGRRGQVTGLAAELSPSALVAVERAYQECRYEDVLTLVRAWEGCFGPSAALANEAGRACLELQRGEEAIRWFDQAVALAPGHVRYGDNRAVGLGRVDRYAESIQACRDRLATVRGCDRRRLLTSIAVNLTFLGRHEEALRAYLQAQRDFPSDPEARVNVMVGYNWLERFGEAADFGLGLLSGPTTSLPPRYWSELAWALHRAGRDRDEEAVIEAWGRALPDDVGVARAMKRRLNALDRPTVALAYVRAWAEAHPEDPWAWRYVAEQLERCGQAEAEIEAMARAARLAPTDAEFQAEFIAVLRRHGRAAAALEAGEAWLSAHPAAATGEFFNRLGLAADDLERWPRAEELYIKAHRLRPAEGIFLGNVLRSLICGGRPAEAVEAGRRWLSTYPWSHYVAGKLAWALREVQAFDEEGEVLRRAVGLAPDDLDLRQAWFFNLIRRGRTTEAGAILETCGTGGRATARMHNEWGNHLRDLGRAPEAEEAYRRALGLNPENEIAAGNLASHLVMLGRAPEAVDLCVDWLERRPADPYVRRQLANALYAKDEHARAEVEYRRLSAQEPESAFLFGRWMACLRLEGRCAEVVELAEPWLSTHRGTAFLQIEVGIAAQRLGRWAQALAHFETALVEEPDSIATALRRLRVLVQLGREREALETGDAWARSFPDEASSDFLNELGILADRLGRLDIAEPCFVRAVERDPENPTLVGNAVEILARQRKLTESIACGQRFLSSCPPNAYLLRRLAEAYAEGREFPAALNLLDTADVMDHADPDIAQAALRIALEGGEAERGVAFGRMWLSRPENGRFAAVWARYARVCFRADHDEEALAAAARAAQLEPDEIAHARLRFGLHAGLGDSRRVLAEYEALRPEWRDDAQLLRLLSKAHRELGLQAEALALAERNLAVNPGDEEACAWLADLHLLHGHEEQADTRLETWTQVHGEHVAVLRVRARLRLQQARAADALVDAEAVLAREQGDEPAFVVAIQALRALSRHGEARARLHHWLEHHATSERIAELLDLLDEPQDDGRDDASG